MENLYHFFLGHPVLYTGLYKYTQPLIVTPKPLPETGVLANHSSDFSLVTQTRRDSLNDTFIQSLVPLRKLVVFAVDGGIV